MTAVMTFAPRLEPYTSDDLRALPSSARLLGGCLLLDTSLSVDEVVSAYPDSPNIELLSGRLVVAPFPAAARHQIVVGSILSWLWHRDVDGIVLPGANVVLDDGTLLIPDVLVVRPGDYGVWIDAADVLLAVEVLSPSTRSYDLDQKLTAYRGAGVPVWIIDPNDKSMLAADSALGLDPADLAASL